MVFNPGEPGGAIIRLRDKGFVSQGGKDER